MPLNPEAGGTERITSLVAKGLSQRGHTCLGILVFNKATGCMTYNDAPVDDLYSFLKRNKVDVVINQIAYATWLLENFLSQGGSRWHQEGGKIISCLHFDPCTLDDLSLLKSIYKPTIRQRLNMIRFALLSNHYNEKKEVYEGSTYNYIYDHSNQMVILSASHYPYLKNVMKREEYSKIAVIGNPLTFDKIADDEILSSKQKVVLVCARMSEYHKRISYVLKAWKRISQYPDSRDWILKIVGDGPDLNRYKKIVEKSKLPRVVFYGHQSPEPFYREASVLLVTSSAEGWGLSITEALQYGVVPVVMDSSPVYNDLIVNCYNGYLTPNNNIKMFAAYCQHLITELHRLKAMQQNATLTAKRFLFDTTIGKWEDLICNI